MGESRMGESRVGESRVGESRLCSHSGLFRTYPFSFENVQKNPFAKISPSTRIAFDRFFLSTLIRFCFHLRKVVFSGVHTHLRTESVFKTLRFTWYMWMGGKGKVCSACEPSGPFLRATSQLPKSPFNCDGHIFISFVFPQFTSFHSVFHSFHGLMNSINWPASRVWVFIAQMVEQCSANAEATGSNPVEAAKKKTFFGLLRNCLTCDSTAMVTYSFQQYLLDRNLSPGLIRGQNWGAQMLSILKLSEIVSQ